MDPLAVVALVVVVAAAAGVGGWLLGRRRGVEDATASAAASATIEVIDSLVADGIKLLRGWLSPSRGGSDQLTLAPDGTITLLFSDIADSTAMNHRLGDERFAELLATHDEIVERIVADHDGRVVKTQGDGFLAAFHDPGEAVGCALDLRDDLADHREVGEPLELRLGVHTGSAVTTDADVFGQSVAFAARVASRARGGEVLVSEAVRDRLAEEVDVRAVAFSRRWFRRSLKGLPGRHLLFSADRP